MTDYSDEQIGRGDLPLADDFESVIRMQAGEIRNSATRAFVKEFNSGSHDSSEYWKIRDADQRWWQIWKDFSWLPDAFALLAEIPSPQGSADLAASVAQVSGSGELTVGEKGEIPGGTYNATGGTLGDRAMDGEANIMAAVQSWQGRAAINFRTGFSKDFPSIIRNQTALAQTLRATALANAGLLLAARTDAQELAVKAKAAFDSFEPGGVDEGLTTGFAVAGAVSTIAAGIAAVPGGSAAAAATLTILAGVNSLASLTRVKEEPMGLGADTVQGIINNVFGGVNKILQKIAEGEEKLIEGVLSPSYAATVEHHGMFVASRPSLIHAPLSEFRPPVV